MPERLVRQTMLIVLALLVSLSAVAHVSEQGLVLLLPTKIYISAGVLAVVLTVLLLAVLPASTPHRLMKSAVVCRLPEWPTISIVSSVLSLVILLALVALGIFGSRDPLKNPLPLTIWTFWWIGLVGIQGFIGNLWYWIDPWRGLCHVLRIKQETSAGRRLQFWGTWPALTLFVLFIMFALAYPAPDDPTRLAVIVATYWLLTFIAMLIFGQEAWGRSGEFIRIVMGFYARMSPVRVSDGQWRIGFPGHRAYGRKEAISSISMATFVLVLLGCGSFDGINETFWWLSAIGINPLEFPGRSAIIGETVTGVVVANVLLVAVFLACVSLGVKWVRMTSSGNDVDANVVSTRQAYIALSISMLPIAFAYHLAHYLIVFLVNMQYLLAAMSDPLAMGSDLLGLGTFYVTTGFLNSHHSVEFLWLLQAGVVVLGHMTSVIMAHGIAVRLFGSARRAAISQIPLAAFMVLYTFLGLWLLASPKGG